MPQSATINSLPEAFEVIKAMELQEYDGGEDYRAAGRAALAEILQGQMALRVDRHLAEIAAARCRLPPVRLKFEIFSDEIAHARVVFSDVLASPGTAAAYRER